jgi:hypothetical protein
MATPTHANPAISKKPAVICMVGRSLEKLRQANVPPAKRVTTPTAAIKMGCDTKRTATARLKTENDWGILKILCLQPTQLLRFFLSKIQLSIVDLDQMKPIYLV